MALSPDSIGDFEFVSLDGDIPAPILTSVEITRPGVDGVAYKTLGVRGAISTLQGFTVAGPTADEAEGLRTGYAGMVSSVQTVIMRGETYSTIYIKDAAIKRRKIAFVQGQLQWLVWSSFTVQDVSVPDNEGD
jgi:hypothetical protein